MKNMRVRAGLTAAMIVAASLFATAAPAQAATAGEGKTCTTIGKVETVKSITYICTQVGSKKVWKKSVADVTFKMPNLKGQILQTAQNKLQSLGSFLLDQEDATGQGRMQILDRKWKVCRQDPKPGAKVSITEFVTLWSVKTSESC